MVKVRLLAAVVLAVSLVSACGGSEPERRASRRVADTTTTSALLEEAAPAVPEDPAVGTGEMAAGAVSDGEDNPVPVGAPRPQKVARGSVKPTGRIEIPAIGLSHATFEGIDLAIINHGPSHWPGTAMPGERGNTVFPGHRTTYSRPFWDIDKLVAGNEVIFTTPAGRFTYRVTESLIVDDQDSWIIRPTEKATFTIFACHPKGSARQRYVVKGELVGTPIGNGNAPTTTAPPQRRPPPQTTTTTTSPPRSDGGIIPDLPR